jgi:hypothetical protein
MATEAREPARKREPKPKPTDVTIRRAPRIGRFIIFGGALGAVGTFVATMLFPADPSVGYLALFGYFALYGIPAGVAAGALAALILERRSVRTATAATAELTSEENDLSK